MPELVGKRNRYLEIGVWAGDSLVWMFDNLLKHPQATAVGIGHRLIPRKYRCTVYRQPSSIWLRNTGYPAHSFDLIYINRDNLDLAVIDDAVLSWPLLRPGGFMIFNNPSSRAVVSFMSIYQDYVEELFHDQQLGIRKKNDCPEKGLPLLSEGEQQLNKNSFRRRGLHKQTRWAQLFLTILNPFVAETLICVGALDRCEHPVISGSWPNCRILNFDADHRTVEDAKRFMESTEHVAVVGNAKAKVIPFYERSRPKTSTIHQPGSLAPTSVKATTLTKIFDKYSISGSNVALWLDCEGGELDILKGGLSVLPSVQWINMEVTWNQKGWPTFMEVDQWMKDNHYRCVNMTGNFGYCQIQIFKRVD